MEDVNLLADLGMNMIRLDVSWAGAEPQRGKYNQTYFEVVHRIVDMCKSRGIYVLLEWHQDIFSERYCGNGAPLWASRPLDRGNRFGFPFPMGRPFKINSLSGLPDAKQCDNFFVLGYGSYALSQAYEDLYFNFNGIRDSFVDFWKKVAVEFRNSSNVIGYEFINGNSISLKLEPWVGQWAHDPFILTKKADRTRLQPFYEAISSGVRQVDDQKLFFIESINIDLFQIGFTKFPVAPEYLNKTVLSWHFYWNPVGKQRYIKARFDEARRFHTVSFASEIDISWKDGISKL